ncbi:phage baseplate assembly protein V [Streptomyces sp. NPDC006631]|uniref:phage baseplate assembly protein V n=1 Tax=Streptomyces sp. NPDC006631 TaxID=3364752 RepID=UPI00369EBDD3
MSAEPMLGMYRGSVSTNQDPLNEARVTLLIPQVLGDAESAWAVPASPTNTVPPVGQTLWVQFSGGDITKPVYSPLGLKDIQDAIGDGGLDGLPPKEPTALGLTTVQFVNSEGATQARVTAGWTPPTENQDGTNLVDLSHYVLQYSYDGTNWSGGQSTQDTLLVLDGLHTGVDITVRVQAVDNSNNASLWATAHITTASSTTPPPVPSAPGVIGVLGGLRVTWDGRDSTGVLMPAIFSHVQVQRDTDPLFTNPVVIGTLPGPDFLYDSVQNYANAYNYRLVAYSKVAIASAPSASNSATPKQAGTGDLAANSVTANQMAVGSITAESGIIASLDATKMTTGTLDAGLVNVTNLDAASIKAGTLTVDKLNAGLQATVGQKFYDFGTNASKWNNGNSTGTLTTVAVTDAASGGHIMRCTGYIQGAYRPDLLIPFDPGVTYRVTARIRQTVANSTPGTNQSCYVGVAGIAADGVTLVNINGAASRGSQGYAAARQLPLTAGSGWQTFTGYIKGTAATGDTGPNPSPTNPMRLHQNVKYISPFLFLNYTGGTGTAEVDVFTIEVVETGQVNSTNINLGNVNAAHLTLGTVSGNLVTNNGFEDTARTGWTTFQTDTTGATTAAKIEVGEGSAPARSGQGKAALGVLNTGTAKVTSDPFPVVAGSVYMFRYWYAQTGHLQITFETSADKTTWTDQLAGANDVTPNAAAYTEDQAEITIPTGAVWGRISFANVNPGSNGLSTTAFSWLTIDDVIVMREGYGATDISPGGLRLYGPEGNLATELSTANAYATFAGGKAAVDSNGVGTFNSLWTPQRPDTATADDPTGQIWYQGKELSDLLWNMPWGIVTYERGWTNRPATGTTGYTIETGLLELGFTAVEGRMYRIVGRSQFDLAGGGTSACELQAAIVASGTTTTLNSCTIITPNGASPTITDNMIGRSFVTSYDGTGTDFTSTVESLIACSTDAGGLYAAKNALAPGDHRILWTAKVHAGSATGFFLRNYSTAQSSDFYVEDIGPAVPEGGTYNTGGAAVTSVKTYTKTYKATWSRRFGNAGNSDGTMYQGYYSGTWGTNKSMVGFGAQPFTDMGSTAKVSKVEIYLYANHWYYNAGGTAHIGTHTQTGVPSGMTWSNNLTVANWPVGAGKWVTLPSSWNSSWNAATPYRGITLGGDLGSSTNKTYYGAFDGVGDTHPPQLRITYTK